MRRRRNVERVFHTDHLTPSNHKMKRVVVSKTSTPAGFIESHAKLMLFVQFEHHGYAAPSELKGQRISEHLESQRCSVQSPLAFGIGSSSHQSTSKSWIARLSTLAVCALTIKAEDESSRPIHALQQPDYHAFHKGNNTSCINILLP